jgi:hypothetical protein
MRPTVLALVACLVLLVGCTGTGTGTGALAAQRTAAAETFSFAAAGDLGANRRTAAALRLLDRSDARFFLALGDLAYDQTATDAGWCSYVRRHLPGKGADFPVELVAGNHEQDGRPDRLGRLAACLPDRMGSQVGPGSRYGAEYAFTYPNPHPFAKVIMISPKLRVAGTTYDYRVGSPHRRWLVRQIDGARAEGMDWVVVGLHYPCLTTGRGHGCDSGTAILNLLLRKQVDLVLTGHNHIYERSKQIRLHRRTCGRIRPGHYDRDCVVDAGVDGRYRKGAGTVLITAGTVGGLEQGVNPADGDHGFFAKTDGTSTGLMKYTVSRSQIAGRFLRTSGHLSDAFRIVR